MHVLLVGAPEGDALVLAAAAFQPGVYLLRNAHFGQGRSFPCLQRHLRQIPARKSAILIEKPAQRAGQSFQSALDAEGLRGAVGDQVDPRRSIRAGGGIVGGQTGFQLLQHGFDVFAGAQAVDAKIHAIAVEPPPLEVAYLDRIMHPAARMDIEIGVNRIAAVVVHHGGRFLAGAQAAAVDLVLIGGPPIVRGRQMNGGPGWGGVWHPVRVATPPSPGKGSISSQRTAAERSAWYTMFSRQFPRLFLWHVARNARRHKLLAALNICSVALGVAVYLAIQIANHSANQSFAASIDLVAGKANLEVRAASGSFDENVFPKLAHAPGVRAATPLVEGYATLPDYPGDYLQILGVDIFTNLPFATFAIGGQDPAQWANLDPEKWLGDPHAVAITDEFARQHGLKVGDNLRLQINGREQRLTLRYLIRLTDTAAGRGNSRVAAMDIGWAQELLNKTGQLSSIQILLDQPKTAPDAAVELAKLVPADVTVAAPGQRSGQIERMLSSFELNLSALSLISLLVGMFLIYNTITASVVRRRVETGILRAVGATRLEVQCLFMGEAVLFGVFGVLLGLVGGMLLARFLLGREIARVISTLYLLVSVDRFYLTPWLVGSALFFGLGSVLAASWLPAWEGARANPVVALSLGLGTTMERSRQHTSWWLLAGALALLAAGGCALAALYTGPAWLGFGSAFFVLLGFALTAPAFTAAGASGVERLVRNFRSPMEIRLAAQNLRRSIHRNAVIVAALMAAIAMTVGISVMIYAFRRTVEVWIDRAIAADIFMTPEANETLGNGAFFPPDVLAALQHDPSVRTVDTVREIGINVRGQRVSMAVVEGDNQNRLAFVGGHAAEKQAAFYKPDRVLVSEPFAHKYRVRDGDTLPIPTPEGWSIFGSRGFTTIIRAMLASWRSAVRTSSGIGTTTA